MPDLHDLLDRRASRHDPGSDLFERVLRRHHRRERNRRIGSAVVAIAVVAVAFGVPLWSASSGIVAGSGDGTGWSTSSSPPATLPNEKEAVAIAPGAYRVTPEPSSHVMPYTVSLPEGWSVQYGTRLVKNLDADGVGFYATSVQRIFADACTGSDGDVVAVGDSVDDLATALLEQPGPQASGPIETTFGGYPASRVDLTVPAGLAVKDCNVPVALQLWFAEPSASEGYTVLFPDTTATVFIVDVQGHRQVFFVEQGAGASDEDRRELQAALDSIRFET